MDIGEIHEWFGEQYCDYGTFVAETVGEALEAEGEEWEAVADNFTDMIEDFGEVWDDLDMLGDAFVEFFAGIGHAFLLGLALGRFITFTVIRIFVYGLAFAIEGLTIVTLNTLFYISYATAIALLIAIAPVLLVITMTASIFTGLYSAAKNCVVGVTDSVENMFVRVCVYIALGLFLLAVLGGGATAIVLAIIGII